MITDLKNKTPLVLGILFLALFTTHEIEHISEAFEIEIEEEVFETDCNFCEDNQSQDLENSREYLTLIDFNTVYRKLISILNRSLYKNYYQRAPPKI